MTIENEKIILTKREKELFNEVLKSSKQADEYFSDCGCDVCPLRLACVGYDEDDCAFSNIFHELNRIKRVIKVK